MFSLSRFDIYFLTNIKYARISFSQEGEDLILSRIFEYKDKGFYIDIGAHHPSRFSNTKILYDKGWHGINIDAMPGSMMPFRIQRKRDINIEAAISDIETELDFFIFNEPALNGFDKGLSEERDTKFFYIKDIIKIKTKTLSQILQNINLPLNIDFMTIDVEGLDLKVLKSNDWQKYRPNFIIIEILENENFINNEIYQYLITKEYKFYSKLKYTYFFINRKN